MLSWKSERLEMAEVVGEKEGGREQHGKNRRRSIIRVAPRNVVNTPVGDVDAIHPDDPHVRREDLVPDSLNSLDGHVARDSDLVKASQCLVEDLLCRKHDDSRE